MKILVFSDSHGELRHMEKAVMDISPDYVIHLGDKINDSRVLQDHFPHITVLSVPGNCDFSPLEPAVRTETIGGVRFFLTHGHQHGVKSGLLRFSLAAAEAGAQVALFGHTHIPLLDNTGTMFILNPGAAGGAKPSCGLVEIDAGGRIRCDTVLL